METSVKEELKKAIKTAQADHLVQGCQKIFSVLKASGMLYEQKIQPEKIGAHPANRDGLGLNARDVMELIHNISGVGYDPSIPVPCCIEVDENDPVHAFNTKLLVVV